MLNFPLLGVSFNSGSRLDCFISGSFVDLSSNSPACIRAFESRYLKTLIAAREKRILNHLEAISLGENPHLDLFSIEDLTPRSRGARVSISHTRLAA